MTLVIAAVLLATFRACSRLSRAIGRRRAGDGGGIPGLAEGALRTVAPVVVVLALAHPRVRAWLSEGVREPAALRSRRRRRAASTCPR